MSVENRIDYIEIPTTDPARSRDFLGALFGWSFKDWGTDYISFSDGRLAGGLRQASEPAPASGVLIVIYSDDLERDVRRVKELGATISQDIFSFPGGRRFHFVDPVSTEYAIWAAA